MLFVDPEKYNYDQQRNLFITQCISHPDVFGCMLQLKNKEDAKVEVEDLKKKAIEEFNGTVEFGKKSQ